MANRTEQEVIMEIICSDSGLCVLVYFIIPVFYILAGAFICLGNLLTIMAVRKTEKLQTVQNLHIVSLAVADTLSGIILFMVAAMLIKPISISVAADTNLCLSLYILWLTSISASNSSIVLIALDRYIYILHPFRYEKWITHIRTKIIIVISWFVSLSTGLGALHFNNLGSGLSCFFFGIMDKGYQLATDTVTFLSVFVIVVFLYTRIITVAYRQQRRIASAGETTGGCVMMWKYRLKNIRLLLTVCGLYCVCWLPYHVMFCIFIATDGAHWSLTFLFLLGVLNSGVNFIVYPCMNRDFRNAFSAILRCCKKQ